MSDKILVEYSDCFGRMGELEGLFICSEEELQSLKGVEIYFGEVLGKHSEVYTDEAFECCKVIPTTKDQIETLIVLFGTGTISGYNPLDFLEE